MRRARARGSTKAAGNVIMLLKNLGPTYLQDAFQSILEAELNILKSKEDIK